MSLTETPCATAYCYAKYVFKGPLKWHIACQFDNTVSDILTAMRKKKMKQQHKQNTVNGHNTHCLKRLHTTSWTVFHGENTHRKEVADLLYKRM